jgi:acyl carrier protein
MIDEIRGIVQRHGRLGTILPADDADLYRAGMSSHACVELMLALEEAFSVEFPDDMLTRSTFCSIGAIRSAVFSLRARALSSSEPCRIPFQPVR